MWAARCGCFMPGLPLRGSAMDVQEFAAYQRQSRKTWGLVRTDHPIVYPTLGLANEAGEVAGKIKKLFRDKGGRISGRRPRVAEDGARGRALVPGADLHRAGPGPGRGRRAPTWRSSSRARNAARSAATVTSDSAMEDLKVVVVGCGTMGASHARAYRGIDGYELAGVVSRGPSSREALARELDATPFASLDEALAAVLAASGVDQHPSRLPPRLRHAGARGRLPPVR